VAGSYIHFRRLDNPLPHDLTELRSIEDWTLEKEFKSVPNVVDVSDFGGSVTQPEAASQCLDAGAQFLTSDGLHPAVVEFGAKQSVVVIPGALTPTEVISAWETSSDFVKVVPCAQIGGPAYFASLHVMFPHIPLIASGGC
jgi:2-keto-3-deoxy-6-phosphogluconate aldolase